MATKRTHACHNEGIYSMMDTPQQQQQQQHSQLITVVALSPAIPRLCRCLNPLGRGRKRRTSRLDYCAVLEQLSHPGAHRNPNGQAERKRSRQSLDRLNLTDRVRGEHSSFLELLVMTDKYHAQGEESTARGQSSGCHARKKRSTTQREVLCEWEANSVHPRTLQRMVQCKKMQHMVRWGVCSCNTVPGQESID